VPHIPQGITHLEQHFPVRFGDKRLFMATTGQGPITSVELNGQRYQAFNSHSVFLPYDQTPEKAVLQIVLGNAKAAPFTPHTGIPASADAATSLDKLPQSPAAEALKPLATRVAAIRGFRQRMTAAGMANRYETAHAQWAVTYFDVTCQRLQQLGEGKLAALPAATQAAADQSYVTTTARLCEGLEKTVQGYAASEDPQKRRVLELWNASK
jgi:hypothetical protein